MFLPIRQVFQGIVERIFLCLCVFVSCDLNHPNICIKLSLSFRLAHMFPDCVGQVDVVSDAENIKKLLKIPYSRGVVSILYLAFDESVLTPFCTFENVT